MWAWENGYWGGAIPQAIFWRWQQLADLEEEEWKGAFLDIIGDDRVAGADLVILDDVGAETDKFKSGAPTARFQTVMEALEHRWLLITTNVPKAKWRERWDGRIASRMEASAFVSLFNVPDYRPNLASK